MEYTECEIPPSSAPIRQGDILFYRDTRDENPWQRLNLILTADCDLAWGKSGSFLSIAPILTVEDYIFEVWAPKRLQKITDANTKEAVEFFQTVHNRFNPSATPLSETAVGNWLQRDDINDICAALQITSHEEVQKISLIHQVHNLALGSLRGETIRQSPLLTLGKIGALKSGKPKETEIGIFMSQASGDLRALPQDVFFLSEIPAVSGYGFLVMLRYMRSIHKDKITGSLHAARDSTDVALRIARLKPTFKYAMAQQFALLFSRIGLPEEYEDSHKTVVSLVCDQIGKRHLGKSDV